MPWTLNHHSKPPDNPTQTLFLNKKLILSFHSWSPSLISNTGPSPNLYNKGFATLLNVLLSLLQLFFFTSAASLWRTMLSFPVLLLPALSFPLNLFHLLKFHLRIREGRMEGQKKEWKEGKKKGQKNKRLECKTYWINYVNNRYYCTLHDFKSAAFPHIAQSDHDLPQLNTR